MMRKLFAPAFYLLIVGLARADDPPASTDQADDPKPAAAATKADVGKPSPTPAASSADADLLKSLEKQLKPDEPEENPLQRVGKRMRDVQGRLVKADSGEETRTIQTDIVKDLDKLIEEMKKGGT